MLKLLISIKVELAKTKLLEKYPLLKKTAQNIYSSKSILFVPLLEKVGKKCQIRRTGRNFFIITA